MSMSQGYDFGGLYQMADMTGQTLIPKDNYDAVCTEAEWGRTKDGTKGQWTVKTQVTTGPHAGTKLTGYINVSPTKNDGTENSQGLGMMFRQLAAFGVPVPPEQQPFWVQGWTEQNVAQAMVGKPLLIAVIQDEYDGVTRNKIRDFRPPRPGAPVQVQQVQQPPQTSYGPGPQGGFAGPQQGQWAPQQNGYPQQPQQGPQGGYGGPQGAQPTQGPTAPGPWQNAQPPAAGPAPVPGAPGWAQPAVPGQGGQGEFTTQGQSYQGYPGQPDPYQTATGQPQPPQGNPQQPPQQWQQPQLPPQGPPQGYPPQTPPQQFQPGGGANGAPGAWQGPPNGASPQGGASPSSPPPQQGQQPQQPPQQGAPEIPPWAQ